MLPPRNPGTSTTIVPCAKLSIIPSCPRPTSRHVALERSRALSPLLKRPGDPSPLQTVSHGLNLLGYQGLPSRGVHVLQDSRKFVQECGSLALVQIRKRRKTWRKSFWKM